MNKEFQSIYKTARLTSGLTQEEASEKLNISTRWLSAYENGKTPPDDIVDNMIQIYGDTRLAYLHLKQSTLIGRKYLPEMQIEDLSLSVLKFQKEYKDIEKIKDNMIEIACDGRIDEKEKKAWNIVTKEVEGLISAGLSIRFMQCKKPSKVALRGLLKNG